MDLHSDPAFQLFRARYSRFPEESSPRGDPVTLWDTAPLNAKILWQSEAGGVVPFPVYDLDTVRPADIIPYKLWYDHYVQVLRQMGVLQPDFHHLSLGFWTHEHAEVVRYWTLKSRDLNRRLEEHRTKKSRPVSGNSFYRILGGDGGMGASPTDVNPNYLYSAYMVSAAAGTGVEDASGSIHAQGMGNFTSGHRGYAPARPVMRTGKLTLSDEDHEYIFKSGYPYVCGTCQSSYRARGGLKVHLDSSEKCDPNDKSLDLDLWKCPGEKVGLCYWQGSSSAGILRHLKNYHDVCRAGR